MEILQTVLSIFAMFLTIIILDYLWLGKITKKFLIKEFGPLVKVKEGSIKIKIGVGILTWLIIAIGCFIFAVSTSKNLSNTMLFGAIFGFITYSIYDLTNLTFIKKYSLKFSIVDIFWGTFLCSIISTIGFMVKNLF